MLGLGRKINAKYDASLKATRNTIVISVNDTKVSVVFMLEESYKDIIT